MRFVWATCALVLLASAAPAADFSDVADNPDKYEGKTVTLLVWLPGGVISRHTLENGDGTKLADGYLAELSDGTREFRKGDKFGNRFGFLSGKNSLNPLFDKEYGRQLKDKLDADTAYKVKVTFTVRKVVKKQAASFDYYIAYITKVEKVN